MRRMVDNTYFEFDESGNLTLGANLYVDGKITSGGSLYCHPILLWNNSSQNRIQFLLFNNNSDAYTDIDALQDDLLAMYEGTQLFIMLSGIYNGAQALYLGVTSNIVMAYVDLNETPGANISAALTLSNIYTNISDGVNKIL